MIFFPKWNDPGTIWAKTSTHLMTWQGGVGTMAREVSTRLQSWGSSAEAGVCGDILLAASPGHAAAPQRWPRDSCLVNGWGWGSSSCHWWGQSRLRGCCSSPTTTIPTIQGTALDLERTRDTVSQTKKGCWSRRTFLLLRLHKASRLSECLRHTELRYHFQPSEPSSQIRCGYGGGRWKGKKTSNKRQ